MYTISPIHGCIIYKMKTPRKSWIISIDVCAKLVANKLFHEHWDEVNIPENRIKALSPNTILALRGASVVDGRVPVQGVGAE